MKQLISRLVEAGLQPSAQRLAIAEYVLTTEDHPTADRVWKKVQPTCPSLSRATVYNTLAAMVASGLLRKVALADGAVRYDPNVAAHHHFVDEGSGRVCDVPWAAIDVRNIDHLRGFDVKQYSVVMHGRMRKR
jgi:Fe2+ or Zn2+ uptake regulation protein